MSGHLSDTARTRRRELFVNGGAGGGEMVTLLNLARSEGYIREWEPRMSPNGIFVDYSIVVVFRNRKNDGSLGRRRGRIFYSDKYNNAQSALVAAVRAVLTEVPEVPV